MYVGGGFWIPNTFLKLRCSHLHPKGTSFSKPGRSQSIIYCKFLAWSCYFLQSNLTIQGQQNSLGHLLLQCFHSLVLQWRWNDTRITCPWLKQRVFSLILKDPGAFLASCCSTGCSDTWQEKKKKKTKTKTWRWGKFLFYVCRSLCGITLSGLGGPHCRTDELGAISTRLCCLTKATGKCCIPDSYSPIVQLGQSPAHQQKPASLDNHLLVWSALTIFVCFTNEKRKESLKEWYMMKDGDGVSTSIHCFS